MKHEWKKHEKNLYLPKSKPELITVGPHKYFTLKGEGNPNEDLFAQKVQALFTLSWSVKMMPKKGFTPDGYFEYVVYPLEGVWSSEQGPAADTPLDKNQLRYEIMIRQPEFVTEEVFAAALETSQKKLDSPWLSQVRLKTLEDGLCVQMMHLGSYDDEPESFAAMDLFTAEHSLVRRTTSHREIYITDATKTAPEKQKTLLRYLVEER